MVSLRLSTEELEKRRDRITSFISDRAAAAGDGEAVIGLSGGVDSSLTGVLAVEALGPNAVLGVSMPAAVSDDRHRTDADLMADELGIPYRTIDVEPLVDAFDTAVPFDTMGTLARGNTRARSRAVLSYAIANEDGRLVLGTGNRSEALVGYFTKYGDGAVDCHPIGNLYKQQVCQLARHVAVPDDIVEKPATAELWEDQSDEEELGLDYDTLDRILALHIDGPLPASATAEAAGCSEATVSRIRSMVDETEHKRRAPPAP